MRNHLIAILILLMTCLATIKTVQADASLAGNDWCRIRGGVPSCNSAIKIYGAGIDIFEDYPRENSFRVLIFRDTLNGRNISGDAFTGIPTCGYIKSPIISGTVSGDLKKIKITYKRPTNLYYCDVKQFKATEAVFIRKQW